MEERVTASPLASQWSEWRRHHGGGNARETAYQIIQEKIINLEFKPGEPLSDKMLAERLNMSRTPVREALIILSVSNMVVLKPQIGTFVAYIDTERMEMEQFARYTMEKEIVSIACSRMNEELKWRYEQNLMAYKHYSQVRTKGWETRLLDLDNEFHRIAFSAAGREDNFFHMLEGMQHIERMRMLSIMGLKDDNTYPDHMAIYQAMAQGQKDQALSVLDTHLNRYKENLREVRERFPEYFA